PPRAERDALREKEIALSQTLVSLGYREIITSSMVDPAENARFNDAASVVLENPLSQEASALRTTALPSMLSALRWNLDRDREDLRFFEMGKIYWKGADGTPQERRLLAVGVAGYSRPATMRDAAKEFDFFDLKGDLESLFAVFELVGVHFVPEVGGAYADKWSGQFLRGEDRLASFGRINERLQADHKLRRPAWLAEIDLERLLKFPLKSKSFRAVSKFPSVERDFSLVVPSAVTFATVAEVLHRIQRPELASFRPMDLFKGGAMGPDHYSLLLRVTLQSQDHTLSGDEITALSQKVLDSLAPLGIRLRGQ
ncbi:MAG: hypothetical protein ACRD18_05355, partial [Terriglobia bacterium]